MSKKQGNEDKTLGNAFTYNRFLALCLCMMIGAALQSKLCSNEQSQRQTNQHYQKVQSHGSLSVEQIYNEQTLANAGERMAHHTQSMQHHPGANYRLDDVENARQTQDSHRHCGIFWDVAPEL